MPFGQHSCCFPSLFTDIPKSSSHPGVARAAPRVPPCTETSQLLSPREMSLCFPLGHQQPCEWAAGQIPEPSPVFPSLVYPLFSTCRPCARGVPVPECASCFHPDTAATNGSWKSFLGSWSCLSIRIDNPDIRINNPHG